MPPGVICDDSTERVIIDREIQIPAEFMLGTWNEVSFDFVTV